MTAEPQRDEMVQFVVLRGAGESVDKPTLDGIGELPGRAHFGRVPGLADRGADRGLGHVGVYFAGDWSPLLGHGRRQDQGGAEERN